MRFQLMDQLGSKGDEDDRCCQDEADEDDQDILDQDECCRLRGQLVSKVEIGIGHEVVQALLQVHDDDISLPVVVFVEGIELVTMQDVYVDVCVLVCESVFRIKNATDFLGKKRQQE